MMNAFNQMIFGTKVVDLGFKGQLFTWTNNWEGIHLIKERLNRAKANATWVTKFLSITIICKLMIGYDHCPMVVTL